ncbi:MAG: hypothetical protein JSS79_18115 [Bacteroidetes bacterium]|nr:hypothetical protein [Bacteroidota bacterium]
MAEPDIDLLYLLKKLTVHFKKKYKGFTGTSNILIKGVGIDDLVAETLTRHYEDIKKFDGDKASLETYLINCVSRSFIKDLFKSSEISNKILSLKEGDIDEKIEDGFIVNTYIDDQMDYESFFTYIENDIKDDKIATIVFFDKYHEGLKRGEIAKRHNLELKDYDLGMDRLNTAFEKASKKFGIRKKRA